VLTTSRQSLPKIPLPLALRILASTTLVRGKDIAPQTPVFGSESQRNRVRLHSGIAFTFDLIPHRAKSELLY